MDDRLVTVSAVNWEETNQIYDEGADEDRTAAVLLGKRCPYERADTISGHEKGDGEGGHFIRETKYRLYDGYDGRGSGTGIRTVGRDMSEKMEVRSDRDIRSKDKQTACHGDPPFLPLWPVLGGCKRGLGVGGQLRTFGFLGSPGEKRMRKGSASNFSSTTGGSNTGSNSWTAVEVERIERASAGRDMVRIGRHDHLHRRVLIAERASRSQC